MLVAEAEGSSRVVGEVRRGFILGEVVLLGLAELRTATVHATDRVVRREGAAQLRREF